MSDIGAAAGYLDHFRVRGEAIAEACTRCGDCFRACPMVAPAGLARADAADTADGIVDLITGGMGTPEAVRWASVCSGSGNCIPAYQHRINPRFMVQLARGFARRQAGEAPLQTRWRRGFHTMSRGVRILSRLQLPPEILARVRGQCEPPRRSAPTSCSIQAATSSRPRPLRFCASTCSASWKSTARSWAGPGGVAAFTSSAKAISTIPRGFPIRRSRSPMQINSRSPRDRVSSPIINSARGQSTTCFARAAVSSRLPAEPHPTAPRRWHQRPLPR